MITWRRVLLPAGVDAGAVPAARRPRACAPSPTATWRCCCRPTCSRSASARSRSASSRRRRCSARRSPPLAVGAWGHRFRSQRLLRGAALLMAATGLGFAALVVVLAACSSSPSSARSTRARATSASSCRSSTRASPARRAATRAPRCSRATACSARCARRSARSPPRVPDWLAGTRRSPTRRRAARACSCSTPRIGLLVWLALSARCRAQATGSATPPMRAGAARAVARHRRQARGAVQRRRVRRRAGRQLADGALAARALRAVARAGRRVLLLGRPAQRRLAARRADASRAASAC